jgi:hypothetical protein
MLRDALVPIDLDLVLAYLSYGSAVWYLMGMMRSDS